FAVPCEEYKINPVLADALDKIFILHADHEQNASTSTVRIAGSSGANPFACIAAGIACLWGPAHGGANEAALAMLAEIGSVDKIPEFIARVKDKNSEVRLMGFGHRVYKNYDPRAKIMQKMCHAVLKETGHGDDRKEGRTLWSCGTAPSSDGAVLFWSDSVGRQSENVSHRLSESETKLVGTLFACHAPDREPSLLTPPLPHRREHDVGGENARR